MRSIFPANFSSSAPITSRLSPQMSLFFQPSSKVSPSLPSQMSNKVGCRCFSASRCPALVDRLDDLEGQAHPWHLFASPVLVILAGPDQFGPGDINFRHADVPPHICFY